MKKQLRGRLQKSKRLSILIIAFLATNNFVFAQLYNCGPVDYYHDKVFDKDLHLESWYKDDDGPFEYIINLSANWWKNAPEVDGWPIWCTAAILDDKYNLSNGAIPGSASAFSIISCLKYYIYTGDSIYLNMSVKTGDYIIQHDLTPSSFQSYPAFPYAVGSLGSIYPDGSGHPYLFSLLNPAGHIQPDKGAMLGVALLELYEVTDSVKYLKTAINIANCLSKNALKGTDMNSPWPMRVMADNGNIVDGAFSANVSFACRLFDELLRIGQTGNGLYKETRDSVWSWLKTYVISYNDASKWKNFFEDHGGDEANPLQLNALETVRYLLEKKNIADPDWFNLSGQIINQIQSRWALTQLDDDGYVCIAEQEADKSPYNSHTARYGSVLAMYYNAGAEEEYKDIAYHSLCYGIYSVEKDGFTNTYFEPGMGAWTTDSFGDFLGHYMDAFAAVPEWAGEGNHLLKSSSTVKRVCYKGKKSVSYTTYDVAGSDKLKLINAPSSVTVDGNSFYSYNWDNSNKVLEINRSAGSKVIITLPDTTHGSGINLSEKNIEIFPNPVISELTISLLPDLENATIAICNLSGKPVYNDVLKSLITTINVSSYKKGIYLIIISKDTFQFKQKFIKQ